MDPTLQKHGAKHIYKVPEGLRELCSDISREVSLIFYCQMLKLSHMPSYNSKNRLFLKLYITHLAWITFQNHSFYFISYSFYPRNKFQSSISDFPIFY